MNKTFLTSATFWVAMVCAPLINDVSANTTEVLIKEQPRHVYHVIKDRTLLYATQQIAQRSGIRFKLNTALETDIVNKKLAAEDWNEALAQLLVGYNYTIMTDKGNLKAVFITGRNGSGIYDPRTESSNSQLMTVKVGYSKLPLHYRNLVAGSVMPIKLPMSTIKAVALGKSILLDLPIGQYTVNHDDFVDDGNGAMTWMGYLEGEGKGYRVYLSQGEAGIMGRVITPDGSYEIETVDGNTYLVDQVRAGLSLGGYDDDQIISAINPGLIHPESVTAGQTAAIGTVSQPSGQLVPTTTSAITPVVDVMVLYTAVKQTPTYAKQRIKYLVNITNLAYKDSFINMRLRLVHTQKTNYAEKSLNDTALSDLKNNSGALAGTSALRTQYGADLVLLFRPYYASTSGGCGIAYVGFSGGSGASPGTGFGVISDGNSKDAPTNYYCGTEAFAHEVGHTLGNVHDREYTNTSGKFPYSYAWGIDNQFGTIMSYKGPSVMLFATPKLTTQCAGHPCGYASGNVNASDQSRTINYTAPFVANYKPKVTIIPVIQ